MRARQVTLVAILVVVTLAALAYTLLRRPQTLAWATERLSEATGQSVVAENVSGSLLGVIHADRVRWKTHAGEVVFEDVDLVWSPLPILGGTIAFNQARARTARLFLRSPETTSAASSARLPVRLRFDELAVGRFIVERKQPIQFLDVSLGIAAEPDAVHASIRSARAFGASAKGELRLGLDAPRPLSGSLSVSGDGRGAPDARSLSIEANGTLERLWIALHGAAASSRLDARVEIAPGSEQPIRVVTASLTDFNPRDFASGWPDALIRAELAAADDDVRGFTGAVVAFNARAGPWSEARVPLVRLRASLGHDEKGWRMPALFFDLGPAGTLDGTGVARIDGIAIDVRAENIDASAVHDELVRTRLAGALAADIASSAQRVRLDLRQKGSRYRLDATRGDGHVRVDELRIDAKGGWARASGTIGLDAPGPFDLRAELRRFDPAVLGRYRAASLNGTLTARGTLDPVLRTEGRIELRPSSAFGLPASGRATWQSTGSSEPSIALEMDSRVGPTHVVARGTVNDPANLDSLDLHLVMEGRSLFELTNVIGVPFPETTAPFKVAGHLTYADRVWEFRDFQGNVGRSDLGGRFAVDLRGERTAMRGQLVSQKLDVRDLWGFVGADPRLRAEARGKLLPRGTFRPETLRTTDADIRFNGRRIVNENLPLRSFEARLVMRQGEVDLDPLLFRAAGGEVSGRIRLDARKPLISGVADVTLRDLSLARVAPGVDNDVVATGKLDGRARLGVQGNTVAAMLASADGDVTMAMTGGTIRDVPLRLANLDLANALGAAAKGNQDVPIRCLVGDFEARDGVIRPRHMLLDTENTLLTGTGQVDLRDERFALRIVAHPKDPSLLSLRGPIRIGGTFADPEVKPELGNAIARTGAAVALGAVAGPLALIPFLQLGDRTEVDCKRLVADATAFLTAGPR